MQNGKNRAILRLKDGLKRLASVVMPLAVVGFSANVAHGRADTLQEGYTLNEKRERPLLRVFRCLFRVVAGVCVLAWCTTAEAALVTANTGFSDGVDRNDPNFVTVSLLVMGPGQELFSCAGHACLRLECPTFKHDYCFSYESESVSDRLLTFFAGRLRMGLFRNVTAKTLEEYADTGRGVIQYKLNLPPDAKQRLWRIMDAKVREGVDLPYDYVKRGCAWSVLDSIRAALPPYTLEYPAWPEKYKLTRRELFMAGAVGGVWTKWFLHSVMGTAVDREEMPIDKVVMPADLLEFLKTCKVAGEQVVQGEGELLLETTMKPFSPSRVTPLGVAVALLLLSVASLFVRFPWMDWCFLVLQTILGVFFTYLVVFSRLPATTWNWLLVPFNILPFVLWKWRQRWAVYFVAVLLVWEVLMVCSPHQLTDPSYLVLAMAYVVWYLKFSPCRPARLKGVCK